MLNGTHILLQHKHVKMLSALAARKGAVEIARKPHMSSFGFLYLFEIL